LGANSPTSSCWRSEPVSGRSGAVVVMTSLVLIAGLRPDELLAAAYFPTKVR
jgi:hypothetical protein